MMFSDGSKYIGDFRNGRREGKGKMIYANNSNYEGEWKNDVMHGKGIYSIDQGAKFEGQFKSGYRIEAGKKWMFNVKIPQEKQLQMTSSSAIVFLRNFHIKHRWNFGVLIVSGTKHWPDGTSLSSEEEKNSTSSFFESASNTFYKESIQRYLHQYQAMSTPTDSIALMDLRANPSMVKAIEQIKRKNSDGKNNEVR